MLPLSSHSRTSILAPDVIFCKWWSISSALRPGLPPAFNSSPFPSALLLLIQFASTPLCPAVLYFPHIFHCVQWKGKKTTPTELCFQHFCGHILAAGRFIYIMHNLMQRFVLLSSFCSENDPITIRGHI